MLLLLLALAIATITLPLPALAQGGAAEVRLRDNRAVPREIADDVSRLFAAPGTRRFTGQKVIEASDTVDADVAILDGTLTIAGRVTGRVVAVNADVVLRAGARVEGDVTTLGGRVDTRDGGFIGGDVRVYPERVQLESDSGVVVVQDPTDDETWYRRRTRWRERGWTDLRLISARTYSRVEGLPILLGPVFGRDLGWGRVTLEALGILRSVDAFSWRSDNVGHSVRGELAIGSPRGLRLGARMFDVVESVEPWQMADAEVGLASFFLHRDFRDYYNRHGESVYGTLFAGSRTDLTLEYSKQRWNARDTRDPYTLFRDTQTWRVNPQMDAGDYHLLSARLRYDGRNDSRDPWSGWHVVADYELGRGTLLQPGPTGPLARFGGGDGRVRYDRGLLDIRRYNRLSPEGQLNVRLLLAGWLSGGELPLQRRLSLGGPGTLPGYDFRGTVSGPDYLTCSSDAPLILPPPQGGPRPPDGRPAECERLMLVQVEYRGDIRWDPFGILRGERDRRRQGWGRSAQWVVFVDAGRGWLVDGLGSDLDVRRDALPPLSTFRTDLGLGLRLDDIGLYFAKSLSDPDTPLNFFVRLRPRF